MAMVRVRRAAEKPPLTLGEFQPPILVVEDDDATRVSLRALLESWGHSVHEAIDGREALKILSTRNIKLVLSDIDMPNLNGVELLKRIAVDFPEIRVIMVSGLGEEAIVDNILSVGAAGYVQKPFRIPELKSQVTTVLKQVQLSANTTLNKISDRFLDDSYEAASGKVRELARLFAVTSDLHHFETGAHIQRIGLFSRLLAEFAGFSRMFAKDLGEAAVLHDIGKLAIPDAILKKPGPLTPEEFEVMKTHPVLGAKILSRSTEPLLKLAHSVALYHHERWDGSGYPEGLKGKDCPIAARIVGVVDVFDALNEKRVYKEAWPRDKIMNFFREKKGIHFESSLVDALLANYESFEKITASVT